MRLRVTGVVDGTDVHTEVVVGGKVSNNKGINLPGVAVSVPALSEKDIEDLRWALHLTRRLHRAELRARRQGRRRRPRDHGRGGRPLPVIAKIEKPQAIENLDEIVDAFDGFMVARGDLGVECPLEDVPFLQKQIIDKARRNAKPVIVATQMLESMISSPAPTRAEASDVANAVLDGADAVMLSGETSVGEYPIETVETMARIVASTEEHAIRSATAPASSPIDWDPHTRGGVIAKAAAEVAERVGRKYLVAFTTSGDSARRLSRLPRPDPGPGLHPRRGRPLPAGDDLGRRDVQDPRSSTPTRWSARSTSQLLQIGRVEEGDLVVIIAGARPASPAPPTPCASTGWATPSTRWRRPTAASDSASEPRP